MCVPAESTLLCDLLTTFTAPKKVDRKYNWVVLSPWISTLKYTPPLDLDRKRQWQVQTFKQSVNSFTLTQELRTCLRPSAHACYLSFSLVSGCLFSLVLERGYCLLRNDAKTTASVSFAGSNMSDDSLG